MPSTPASRLSRGTLMFLLGASGMAAAWVLLALSIPPVGQAAWLAVLAAADAALLARLAGLRPGWTRATWGVLMTVAVVVLANWGLAASRLGAGLGLLPWEAIPRLGPWHAWTLVDLANGLVDRAWYGAALVIAAVTSR